MEYEKYMLSAISQAEEALMAQEVPVGCIFIFQNKIISQSRNTVNLTKNATRHAELNCIDQVMEYCRNNNLDHFAIFKEIEVVVTVEPCIMCADILYNLKVKKIIFGCANDRFGGNTVVKVSDLYPDLKTTVVGGIFSDRAMSLLKEFYKGTNPNAPCPKVKVIIK
ncbi:tRNA-specific adenosine deaminase 2 [Ctenocephalides felis]|uniref:tRNA-specific adenosine deaminase 2 n=1 Tax=Ctenocephalides felis TaxID=7515 RepID=UPI000E6E1A7E|nr:tRNA-specific adenosine deaminase 2 [Ctenocephalides felis]